MRIPPSLLLAQIARPAVTRVQLPRLEPAAGLRAPDYRDPLEFSTHLPAAETSPCMGMALAWVCHQR